MKDPSPTATCTLEAASLIHDAAALSQQMADCTLRSAKIVRRRPDTPTPDAQAEGETKQPVLGYSVTLPEGSGRRRRAKEGVRPPLNHLRRVEFDALPEHPTVSPETGARATVGLKYLSRRSRRKLEEMNSREEKSEDQKSSGLTGS